MATSARKTIRSGPAHQDGGLGHQSRREVVRSDKFVEQYDTIIKSWVTWIMRAIYPGDPPWIES